MTAKIELELHGRGAESKVIIDGQNVAKYCTNLVVYKNSGGDPELTLTLVGDISVIADDVEILAFHELQQQEREDIEDPTATHLGNNEGCHCGHEHWSHLPREERDCPICHDPDCNVDPVIGHGTGEPLGILNNPEVRGW